VDWLGKGEKRANRSGVVDVVGRAIAMSGGSREWEAIPAMGLLG
jgi:hypothetical protein